MSPGAGFVHVGKLLIELLLLLIERLGVLAHAIHVVIEIAGGGAADLLLDVVELFGGALGGGGGLLQLAVVEIVGGAADVFPGLVELLPRIGHAVLIFGLVHAIAEFIGVAEHLPLLIAEGGELAFDGVALLLIAGLLQGGLSLAHLAIEVFLALGEFAQSREDLAIFALLGLLLILLLLLVLLLLGVALGFVAVVLIRKVELVELLLAAGGGAVLILPLIRVAADDVEFMFTQLEQIGIGGLCGGEGIG